MNATEHRSGGDEARVLAGLEQDEWLRVTEAERAAARALREDVARRQAAEASPRAGSYRAISVASVMGWMMVVAGLATMAFFFFLFPIAKEGAEVVNVGLLNERLCGVIASGVFFLAGVIVAMRKK